MQNYEAYLDYLSVGVKCNFILPCQKLRLYFLSTAKKKKVPLTPNKPLFFFFGFTRKTAERIIKLLEEESQPSAQIIFNGTQDNCGLN